MDMHTANMQDVMEAVRQDVIMEQGYDNVSSAWDSLYPSDYVRLDAFDIPVYAFA